MCLVFEWEEGQEIFGIFAGIPCMMYVWIVHLLASESRNGKFLGFDFEDDYCAKTYQKINEHIYKKNCSHCNEIYLVTE